MPLTASPTLRTVIQGVDYRVDCKLTMPDLPGGAYSDFTRCVQSISLSDQMSSNVPDGVRVATGLASVTGQIVLSGFVDPLDESKTVVWLFDPDSKTSPLYRLSINDARLIFQFGAFIDGSSTAEMPTRLDGWVRGYDPDPLAGTVTLYVTDVPPAWRATPSIPGVVTVPPFNAELTSEFALDQVIRAIDGDSSWPAQRPQCVLAVGMRGTAWPEVGNINTALPPTPAFTQGIFGTALGPQSSLIPYTFAPLGDDITTEFWVGAGTNLQLTYLLEVTAGSIVILIAGGNLTVRAQGTLSDDDYVLSGVITTDQYVGIHINFPNPGSAWSITVRTGGTTYSSGPRTATFSRDGDLTAATITSLSAGSFEAWQMTGESSPVWNDAFVPHFICDPSLNPLDAIPPIDDGSQPYDVLQQIVSAENGYIRRRPSASRPDGVWIFTNRINLLSQAVADPITSNESIKTLSSTVPPSTYYRTIRVPYTGWSFDDPTIIWSIPGKKRIPALSTVVWQQKIDGLAAQIDGAISLLPDGRYPLSSTDAQSSWFRASRDRAGLVAHTAITMSAVLLQPGLVEITAVNFGGYDAWLVVPGDTYTDLAAGTPSLWIGGTPATSMDEAIVKRVYGDGAGVLTLDSNPYLQDHDTAAALGDFWLNQLFMSWRDVTNVSIVPRADLDTADLRRLTETNGGYFDDYVMVFGWGLDITFPPAGDPSGGSLDMSVDAHALAPPDGWIGGAVPGRAEASTSPTTGSWAYA